MKRVVVRYKVKADRLEEHEDLIRKVFAELAIVRPTGLAYHALKLEDGVSFVHFATVSTADGQNPLTTLPAFKAFAANIARSLRRDSRSIRRRRQSAHTAPTTRRPKC